MNTLPGHDICTQCDPLTNSTVPKGREGRGGPYHWSLLQWGVKKRHELLRHVENRNRSSWLIFAFKMAPLSAGVLFTLFGMGSFLLSTASKLRFVFTRSVFQSRVYAQRSCSAPPSRFVKKIDADKVSCIALLFVRGSTLHPQHGHAD